MQIPDVDPRAFLHPQALVDPGARVGARTRVWAYAHVLPGAAVGTDGNLCDHVFVEGGVRLGDRVTVKSGVFLWDGLTAEDDVFIGPAAVFTNDRTPRSGVRRAEWDRTLLRRGCSIGANATILPVTVGEWALVAAGAVVTRSVPAFALVLGNPARRTAWVCRCAERLAFEGALASCACGRTYRLDGDTVSETTADGD
jgi:acetyltransferase-like isoleucine patch superfamily enzyme